MTMSGGWFINHTGRVTAAALKYAALMLLIAGGNNTSAVEACPQMDRYIQNFSENYDCTEPEFWWVIVGDSVTNKRRTIAELIGERN